MKLVSVAFVGLAALVAAGCATQPPAAVAAPVLSWPGDPATTIAISWYAGTVGSDIEVQGPAGAVPTSTSTADGPFATVTLTGLDPGTRYRYRIADGPWERFTTQSREVVPLSFALLGDLQPFNEETDRTTRMVIAKVASLDPAFAVQVGDVAEIGISASSWHRTLGGLALLGAGHPLVMTAGNHDYYYGVPSAHFFKSIFPAPYDSDQRGRDTWYSTTVSNVHIAVLDTEAKGASLERQLVWLDADLAAARSAGVAWILVTMHKPVLETATATEGETRARAFLPVFARYGVDAVFAGHDHLFEHFEYTYGANGYVFNADDRVATKPLQLFTTGTSGARVDPLYPGFFTHLPYAEKWRLYTADTGEPALLEFSQRPWRRAMVKLEGEGIRYQRTDVYPNAASFYSYPFASAEDAATGRYSDDQDIRYSDDAEFFGYTYGETSIHYVWIETTDETCTITIHYADGKPGEQGSVMTTPDGVPQRWVLTRRPAPQS